MGKSRRVIRVLAAAVAVLAVSAVFFFAVHRPDDEIRMIYIPKIIDSNNDFWTQLIEGAGMAAKEYGVDLTVVAPDSEGDYERQNELIEWAVSRKPDVILLSPASYTQTTPMAEKIVENGIRLVLIDSKIDKDIADSVVATDNVRAGAKQGAYIGTLLEEDAKIAVIGHVRNSSTAIEREQGLRRGLGEDQGRIADVVFCDSSYDKAYALLEELISRHPDIKVVAGLNEYSAVGAARAVKDLGLSGKVRVVGFDSSQEEIQLLEEGVFRGIVIQMPFKMGYMGVEAACKAAKGENVRKNIDSGCELITADNMYTEENQKLLFPFREE